MLQGILVLLIALALSCTCYLNVISWALMFPIILASTMTFLMTFLQVRFSIIFRPFYSTTQLFLSYFLISHHIKITTFQQQKLSQTKPNFCELLNLSSGLQNTSTSILSSQIIKMAKNEKLKNVSSLKKPIGNANNWSVFSKTFLYLLVIICLGSSKYLLILCLLFVNKLKT